MQPAQHRSSEPHEVRIFWVRADARACMNPVGKALWYQFGLTPKMVRAQRHLDNIELVEPIKMDETLLTKLEPPRFENGKPLLIAGLSERYSCETSAAIPAQWQRFLPHLGNIPGQVGRPAYGVRCNSDEAGNMDYICGVEVWVPIKT